MRGVTGLLNERERSMNQNLMPALNQRANWIRVLPGHTSDGRIQPIRLPK